MSCLDHKRSLIRFLMIKTAGVRAGIKPGTLLRVVCCRHTPDNVPDEKICHYLDEILADLKLDFRILRHDSKSALVLFYDPELLERTLNGKEEHACLARYGYPVAVRMEEYLDHLENRCTFLPLPHEVGIFIGYPPKDVTGFMEKAARTPIRRGDWQVFGDPGESLRLMRLYRYAEHLAEKIIENCQDMESCLDQIAHISIQQIVRS